MSHSFLEMRRGVSGDTTGGIQGCHCTVPGEARKASYLTLKDPVACSYKTQQVKNRIATRNKKTHVSRPLIPIFFLRPSYTDHQIELASWSGAQACCMLLSSWMATSQMRLAASFSRNNIQGEYFEEEKES